MHNDTETMTYATFRQELIEDSGMSPDGSAAEQAGDLYTLVGLLGISSQKLAARAATATGLHLVQTIHLMDIDTNAMSLAFARRNGVLPIKLSGNREGLVVANPFDVDSIDVLRRSIYRSQPVEIMVASPEQIHSALDKFVDPTEEPRKPRLATTSTTQGERHKIGKLNPAAEPAPLEESGMTPEQSWKLGEVTELRQLRQMEDVERLPRR